MKAFTTIFHKGHQYDPTLSYLFREFEIVNNVNDCDVVILPITYQDNYAFDQDLMEEVERSGKKIVVVDFVEYGWDVPYPSHIFGVNTNKWMDKFKNLEYLKLDEFIYRNSSRVAVYFKRELVAGTMFGAPFKILPAEYPGVSTLPENPTSTFEEFNNRPIDVIMVWGLSNPSRPILHGEFVKQSALNGQHLVSNLDHVTICQKRGDKRMVVMAHVPDFARISNSIILHLQSMAKISISLNGAGKKCFRHTESSYNSVMALQENGLDWAYPWVDGVNSIELPNRVSNNKLIDEHASYSKIMSWLDAPEKLYEMYLNGIGNWKNYEVNKYATDYILKEIKSCL
jgi:hypothetical protein